jgi:hypothetical protein
MSKKLFFSFQSSRQRYFCTLQPQNSTAIPKKLIYCHFYKYASLKNTYNAIQLKSTLERDWKKLGVSGRVYVAIEGYKIHEITLFEK